MTDLMQTVELMDRALAGADFFAAWLTAALSIALFAGTLRLRCPWA